MHVYHLSEIGAVSPPAITPLFYGRYLAPVQPDGTIVCDDHRFVIDGDDRPSPGNQVMIWCSRDYYCCPATEYEASHRQ